MDPSEEDFLRCVDCGASVEPTADQLFTFGATGALCGECAMRRGGVYDAQRDDWVEEPSLEGLDLD
jgi:hypothetical protein